MRDQTFCQSKSVNTADSPADPSPRRPMCLDVTGRLAGRGGGGKSRSLGAIWLSGKRVLLSRSKGSKA